MIEARIRHGYGDFVLDMKLRSQGPVLGVFGASGAGKTTLLHCVAGLIKPDDARIAVKGRVVCQRPGGGWTPPEKRRLAIVTQDPLCFPT